MKSVLLAAALLPLSFIPAQAGEWQHAAASMGQFEGRIQMEDGAYGVDYGCSHISSSVGFFAEGAHVAKGLGSLHVDGEEVYSGPTTYNSKLDRTMIEASGREEYGPESKAGINKVLNALGSGMEAVWTTPDGTSFTVPLTGSAKIKSCVIR